MDQVEIREIFLESAGAIKLSYRYSTDSYYELTSAAGAGSWDFGLKLLPLDRVVEKSSESEMFSSFVEKPKAFKAIFQGKDIAYLQLGHDTWNNRVRIWELLVLPEYRRMDVGSKLMELAISEAKKLGARALVLETQSCNVPAIKFYLKHNFQLIGFDLTHYSNDDVARKEVRLELGLTLAD